MRALRHRATPKAERFIPQVSGRACGKLGCRLVLLFISHSALADTRVVVQAASDWVYHGTTETFSQAALGANIEWQGRSAFFAGVEAHQGVTPATQQRHRAVMAYAGYSQRFSEHWHGSATFARRFFPGAFKEWNYNELKLELAHASGWSMKLDYAADYYDHDTTALVGEVGYRRAFGEQQYGFASGGAAQLGAERFSDYEFARLGAGWSKARVNVEVSYGWNSEDGRPQFGDERLRSAEFLMQLSYQVR